MEWNLQFLQFYSLSSVIVLCFFFLLHLFVGISVSRVSKVHQSPLTSGRKETTLPIDALLMYQTFSAEAQCSDLFICFYCYIYLLSFHIFALCQCYEGEDHWFMLLVSCSLRSLICFCVFICYFTVCGVRLYCMFQLVLG